MIKDPDEELIEVKFIYSMNYEIYKSSQIFSLPNDRLELFENSFSEKLKESLSRDSAKLINGITIRKIESLEEISNIDLCDVISLYF